MIQVWYHYPCNDGLAAAAAVYAALGTRAVYEPVNYGKQHPEFILGDHIIIVDFSYPYEKLLRIKEKCGRLTVLDHHKTAQDDLVGKEWPQECFIHFDMNQSGASLAWRYFHTPSLNDKNIKLPRFLQLIQDWDLWRFEYGDDTRNLNAGLQLTEQTPESWVMLLNSDVKDIIKSGEIVEQYRGVLIEEHLKHVKLKEITTGESVRIEAPHVNCSSKDLVSALGHRMCEKYPNHQMAVIWSVENRGIVHSLRSNKDFDVSQVAKFHGGGGHKNAAGFVL